MNTAEIIPTVTASDVDEFQRQLDLVLSLTKTKAHIDLSDGQFSPVKMIDIEHVHMPEHVRPDIHLMVTENMPRLHTAVSLHPRVVTVHAESSDVDEALRFLIDHGIGTSLGILPETPVDSAAELIKLVDEVLIFGGRLGYKGGVIDLEQTAKITQVRSINPDARIAWDGGIKSDNIVELRQSGVDVFYIGSAISRAEDPVAAYNHLTSLINE